MFSKGETPKWHIKRCSLFSKGNQSKVELANPKFRKTMQNRQSGVDVINLGVSSKGRVNYLQMQTFCTHCLWHAWTPWTVSNLWCLLFFSIWLNLKGCNSQWRGCDIHSIIAVVSVFRQHPPFLLFSAAKRTKFEWEAVWCSTMQYGFGLVVSDKDYKRL